ncbi:hypothetical protein Pelo_4956 [Pelomyxa schiedti]|nr:hypothetical protein Pelo_4956 [Pelomyxa schiedti]
MKNMRKVQTPGGGVGSVGVKRVVDPHEGNVTALMGRRRALLLGGYFRSFFLESLAGCSNSDLYQIMIEYTHLSRVPTPTESADINPHGNIGEQGPSSPIHFHVIYAQELYQLKEISASQSTRIHDFDGTVAQQNLDIYKLKGELTRQTDSREARYSCTTNCEAREDEGFG